MHLPGEDPDRPQVVARGEGVLGEVVLRRRGAGTDAVHELVVGGTFLMDTVDVSTERLLAGTALDALDGAAFHVVVGGLGLGHTAAAVLADPRVARVTVVEIEPLLVGWLREGVLPVPPGLLEDDRLVVEVGDVADVVARLPPSGADAVLLDVDNGPDFLVHDTNARLYEPALLGVVARSLRPGGVAGVWSASPSPRLASVLRTCVGPCSEHLVTVRREGRSFEYAVYLAIRP